MGLSLIIDKPANVMCWVGLGHLIKPVSKVWLGTESCSQDKYLDAVQPQA